MEEQLIKPKTLGGLVRSLSGLFITKENPSGLSPKECMVLAMLLFLVKNTESKNITKEIKVQLSNQLNQSLQVTLNYINKFKKKNVVLKDNTLHPILFKQRVIIDGTDIL